MAYSFPGKERNLNLAVCTYNKNDKGGCEPEELDLFAHGMVYYGMTYRLLLDIRKNALQAAVLQE